MTSASHNSGVSSVVSGSGGSTVSASTVTLPNMAVYLKHYGDLMVSMMKEKLDENETVKK